MTDSVTADPITGYTRVKVICVFRHGSRILVSDGYDPVKRQQFYVPHGGRVEFGELSVDALRREMMEELGTTIHHPIFLGLLENIFTFDDKPGHEIVLVYDAELGDRSLYETPIFESQESDGAMHAARWIDISAFGNDDPPLYPDGLLALLAQPSPGISE